MSPGNRSATIRWAAPSSTGGADISSYLVQRSTSPSGGFATFRVVSGSARSAISSGLTNGQRYYFRVIARNVAGTSAPSNVASTIPADGAECAGDLVGVARESQCDHPLGGAVEYRRSGYLELSRAALDEPVGRVRNLRDRVGQCSLR